MFNNINWETLYSILRKAQQWWGMTEKVLTNTGATGQAQKMMYKAVVQTVFMYGSKNSGVT